jgi:tetratricopeptide (TPR) repeat protein
VGPGGIPTFDFRQVLAARSLIKLLTAGVNPRRLMRSLCLLRTWMPDDDGLSRLAGLNDPRDRLLFRTNAGRLAEANGQLLIDYETDDSPATVVMQPTCDNDDLFERAVQFEQDGETAEAARCYRQLLLEQGPDADVCFNLANTLHSMGETAAAVERLYEAVTIDRDHVDAWNNLGHFLADLGRLKESAEAYRTAVTIEPEYPDAHYGLADVLERLGRNNEARSHWRVFLQNEPTGSYADYARHRLSQLA